MKSIKNGLSILVILGVGAFAQQTPTPPTPISDAQAKQIYALQAQAIKAQRAVQDEEARYTELQRKAKLPLQALQTLLQSIAKSNNAQGYQLTPDLQWTLPAPPPKPEPAKAETKGDKSPAVTGDGNKVEVK